MVSFNKGFTFSDGDAITVERLHDLVDKGRLVNAAPSMLATDGDMARFSEPAVPSEGQTGGFNASYLQFYTDDYNSTTAFRDYPESVYRAVTQTHTALPGMAMVMDPISGDFVAPFVQAEHAPSGYYFLGVCLNTANPGVTAEVLTKGLFQSGFIREDTYTEGDKYLSPSSASGNGGWSPSSVRGSNRAAILLDTPTTTGGAFLATTWCLLKGGR